MVTCLCNPGIKSKPKPNGFDAAINVVKNGQKDFLRSMRFSVDWARESYTALKKVPPLNNFTNGIKGAEDFLAFGEFFQSVCKVGSSVTNAMKIGVTKSYVSLKASALEFIWNLFKVMKCLKRYGIFILNSHIFNPLNAIGGMSFTINSADKALDEFRAGNKVLNANPKEDSFFDKIDPRRLFCSREAEKKNELAFRDATANYHLFKTAKNLSQVAIGTIVTFKGLIGFVAPGIVMLTLGTIILISNTAASIIKESNHLKI